MPLNSYIKTSDTIMCRMFLYPLYILIHLRLFLLSTANLPMSWIYSSASLLIKCHLRFIFFSPSYGFILNGRHVAYLYFLSLVLTACQSVCFQVFFEAFIIAQIFTKIIVFILQIFYSILQLFIASGKRIIGFWTWKNPWLYWTYFSFLVFLLSFCYQTFIQLIFSLYYEFATEFCIRSN